MASWTPQEDAKICDLRTRGAEIDAIAKQFPHRTRGAVEQRVRHLIARGLVERRGGTHSNERWTTREDAILIRELALGTPFADIVARFPHRTIDAVVERMGELGEVHQKREMGLRKPWSTAENRTLERLRRQGKTMVEMAVALGRTVAAVNGRIAILVRNGEFEALKRYQPWTAEEDRQIARLRRRGKSTVEIAMALRRSRVSVERHIVRMPRPDDLDE